MARDLNFPIEVVVCPTVREPDGLAQSSRNAYLDLEQRKAATVLYRALTVAKEAYEAGERDAEALRVHMRKTLAAEPLALIKCNTSPAQTTIRWRNLKRSAGKPCFRWRVFVGKTRLIDNDVLE
jgi:pantoate--beta-alanine ligase